MDPRQSLIADLLLQIPQLLKTGGAQDHVYSDIKGYLAKADLSIQEYIFTAIQAAFPDDGLLGEEGEAEETREISEYLWILDPICGTTNFVWGFPFFAHSLSVMNSSGVLFAGIYDSRRDELFLADRCVTTLNGKPVRVSDTRELNEAVIAVNCNQSAWMDDGSVRLETLVTQFAPPVTRRIRVLESANLEMAYISCGRIDGYVNPVDKVWDIAAGSLMISSAGGSSSILEGSLASPEKCKGTIAANGYLLNDLTKTLYPLIPK